MVKYSGYGLALWDCLAYFMVKRLLYSLSELICRLICAVENRYDIQRRKKAALLESVSCL